MMLFVKKKIILVWFVLSCTHVYSKGHSDYAQTGNLALPSSQQPGPIFGFGQNIVDKGDVQFLSTFSYLKGKDKQSYQGVPSILYGITNHLSALATASIDFYNQEDGKHASGIRSAGLQLEYEIITRKQRIFIDSVTIVGGFDFPIQVDRIEMVDESDKLISGFNSPRFFIGTTLSRTMIDWYFYASPGTWISLARKGTKVGNEYLIQGGVGRNIPTSSAYILMGILEFNGIFENKDTIGGMINDSSGGAILYAGPSLWFSTAHWTLQAGIAFPLYQHLHGSQNNNHYLAALAASFKF